MSKKNYRTSIYIIIFSIFFAALCLILYLRHNPDNPASYNTLTHNGILYLGQGWDIRERQQLSYTSFGSRIINYAWFITLENAESEELFRDNTHLARLGFLPEPAHEFNPDGLPIGITQDNDEHGNAWVGLTCAACHMGEIIIKGQPIRIDGGQSLINYTQFEVELLAALKAVLAQPEKWQRFVTRLQQTKNNIDSNRVKQQIIMRVRELKIRSAMNATPIPYGHGRLDAFGQIFNAVAVDALGIQENKRTPDAPTSFPVLWDASHLDVVQWNASAPNKEPGPLAQNATTALAVYGTVDVLGHANTYPSSIKIDNLGYIQREFYKLISPKWPEALAGKLDDSLRNQGEKIYQKECLQCHSLVDSNDLERQLSAVIVPATDVGTDAQMVNNFSEGSVKTGELEGKHFALWFGKKFTAEATRLDVVMHVTLGALLHYPWDTFCSFVTEYSSNKSGDLDVTTKYYKARPINGIWASAPYLHNGSVPTVYDLLLPVNQRPTKFFVGNREFDNVKLGNQTIASDGTSLFDTSLLGNSNSGHEYGTQLNEPDRLALLEYIKSL